MDERDIAMQLGRIEGTVSALVPKIEHLHNCVDELKAEHNKTRGIWKAIGVMGGAAGGAVGLLLPWFQKALRL